MKMNYYPSTDSLYIDLSDKPSSDSLEISTGVVLDYDSEGNITGIDIDNARNKLSLEELTLSKLPIKTQTITA